MDHTDVVARIKAQLETKGVSLEGADGAGEIVKRVAWELRGEGAGLRRKPGGAGFDWNGVHFAADIISYLTPEGAINVDILGDAGGANTPGWNAYPPDPSVDEYHTTPMDPGDASGGNDAGEGGNGQTTPVGADVAAIVADIKQTYVNQMEAFRGEINAKLDAQGQKIDALREAVASGVPQILAALKAIGLGGLLKAAPKKARAKK